jgi:hypothetical protein
MIASNDDRRIVHSFTPLSYSQRLFFISLSALHRKKKSLVAQRPMPLQQKSHWQTRCQWLQKGEQWINDPTAYIF